MAIAAAAASAFMLTFREGYQRGVAANEARHAAEVKELNDELDANRSAFAILNAARIQRQRDATELERRLSDEAAKEVTVDDPGLAPGFLRGLNAIK
jgi:hypothetical protein